MADLGQQILERLNQAPTNDLGSEIINRLQTASQLGSASNVNAIPAMRPPPQGIEKFARPGVDLDVTTGAPLTTRLGLSFASTDEDKLARLRSAFNGATIDQADGNFIVRNLLDPNSGKPTDLLVDEQDITLKDVADLADAGVQGVAELLLLKGLGRFTQGMGRLGRLTTESAVGAAGSEAVGGATDVAQRLVSDQPLQLSEIAARRARGAAVGTGLGFGMGAALSEVPAGSIDAITGKTTGALGPGESERVGLAALRELNRDAPQPILPTLGQIAENPDVMRFETVMSKMPILGRLFREPMEQQDEALRALQVKALGNEPLTPLGDLGMQAAETIRAVARKPAEEAKAAETSLIQRATDELDTALTRLSPQARPFTAEGVGALAKLSVRNQHQAFRQKADELFEEAGDPIIRTTQMQQELARIRQDLPKRTVISESQITDVAGRPLATTEGREIVNELVPEKLNRLMRGLDQLDPQMPLSELRRIRNTIDSAIVDGRGLPEVSTHELVQLRGAITKTIDDGVKALGDTDVSKRLQRANTFYREGIDRFEVPMVSRLLKEDPNQPGFVRAFELLNELQRNPDSYRDLERFMRGAVTESGQAVSQTATRQFNVVRRSLVEELFSRAKIQLGQTSSTIDAGVILGELNQLKPQVRASLLGGEAQTITRNLELLGQLKKGYKDIPEDALRDFLNRPNNSVQDLSRLATAKKKEREIFENTLLKKFLKGDADSTTLPHNQIVDWLLNSKNTGEVSDFMAKIGDNPELVDRLRRQYLYGFLQKNRAPLSAKDAARLDDPSAVLSPGRLAESLKDQTTRQNLRNILGDESFNFVENFTKAQAIIGKQTDAVAQSAGGMAATSAILDIFRMLRHPTSTAKHLIFSIIMTNRNLRQAVMDQSTRKPLDTQTFTRYILSSTPMVEALGEELGKTGTELLLSGFEDSEQP